MNLKFPFASEDERKMFSSFLSELAEESSGMKQALERIMLALFLGEATTFYFHPRRGVSYSLRAGLKGELATNRPYYAIVDIIRDSGGEPWLSVCFYADTVSDPQDFGNLIPNGLLGEDGYCFDVDPDDDNLLSYIEARINEAYQACISMPRPSA